MEPTTFAQRTLSFLDSGFKSWIDFSLIDVKKYTVLRVSVLGPIELCGKLANNYYGTHQCFPWGHTFTPYISTEEGRLLWGTDDVLIAV